MFASTRGIFDVSYSTADLLFLFAFVTLAVVGVVAVVQKSTLQGLAWIATGLIAFALMFLTP